MIKGKIRNKRVRKSFLEGKKKRRGGGFDGWVKNSVRNSYFMNLARKPFLPCRDS